MYNFVYEVFFNWLSLSILNLKVDHFISFLLSKIPNFSLSIEMFVEFVMLLKYKIILKLQK